MKKKLPIIIIGAALVTAFLAILFLYIHDRLVVDHYNKGREYYENEDYTEAYNEFATAEKYIPFGHDDCDARINEVLSLLNRYDWSGKSVIDGDALKKDLLTGREILLAKGWARDDDVGRDIEAQKLKEDIDKLLEELENSSSSGGSSSDNQDQNNGGSSGQDQNNGGNSGQDQNDGGGSGQDQNDGGGSGQDQNDGGGSGQDQNDGGGGGQSPEDQHEQDISDALQEIQQGSARERAESEQQTDEWNGHMNFDSSHAIW